MEKRHKITYITEGGQECVMSTREYIRVWVRMRLLRVGRVVSAVEFVNTNGEI